MWNSLPGTPFSERDQARQLTPWKSWGRSGGLFLGLSSGINLGAALLFAKERGAGQTIVTILCDSGHKYQSTLFNPGWLATHGLDPNRAIESIPLGLT